MRVDIQDGEADNQQDMCVDGWTDRGKRQARK